VSGPLPNDDYDPDAIPVTLETELRYADVKSMPVLELLPSDFPVCDCGHLRAHHEMDHSIHALGKCAHQDCGCAWFVARAEDMPQPEPRRRW
jgi:hypothetical protein